ncbi:hypothetical protein [Mycobacteroides abscessus]|uniref:hypothetical protein n=1 Tax=Mycobacteroides abscessus TaxID=36809 RepID=UPI0009265A18|nr:hypothetical protein [Mycobacteroides abscessus]SHZ38567.1 Uncharacterised protein [Mycobacteroides abscessus subsp. abscessus]SHZ40427.1 Uncharacterised protein [Mycobacteroides abscessus subsp. abscessus]SKT22144.1 Uncharacterised protein [Mycobacteroides abscessus subsp. bolletii]
MIDFADIDLDNIDLVEDQITERRSSIDRMESEITKLEEALYTARRRAEDDER